MESRRVENSGKKYKDKIENYRKIRLRKESNEKRRK